jgi:AAA family ATP:ADP antiporter
MARRTLASRSRSRSQTFSRSSQASRDADSGRHEHCDIEAVAVAIPPPDEVRRWRLRIPAGAGVAVVACAAMIAQQVAGKATRDALFLSRFRVGVLPAMMAISAAASLLVVLWLSRMMVRHTPAKVVPTGFGVSALALLGVWALDLAMPRLAAVALYLFTSLFGAAMVSAFWSLVDERFDPHTSRQAATAIATGGTVGGLLGGLAAWRISHLVAVPTMLPLLAGASLVSMGCSLRMRRESPPAFAEARDGHELAAATFAELTLGPLRAVQRAPYLRNLAAIVALGAVTSGLLDYLFSAAATRAFSKGPQLLAFFSVFWLVVAVVSLLLEVVFGKVALRMVGIGLQVALLPAFVVLGGAVALALPGLGSIVILRGGEAARRNSLFRAAYEMLYTSLSKEKRRATKTIIDVGFDRLGTVAASGAVALALALTGARAETVLLVLTIGVALITLVRSLALHAGYVSVLERSLRNEVASAGLAAPALSLVPEERIAVRDEIVEQLGVFPHTRALAAAALSQEARRDARAPAAIESFDASLRSVAELHSRDSERVRRVLSSETPLSRPVVSFAILLLADKDLHSEVILGLRTSASKTTGQLVDALCDDTSPFDVRRRIPRVLAECPTQDAANGLIRGVADARFEVRYECVRALLDIRARAPDLVVAPEWVVATVKREVLLGKDTRESQRGVELDEQDDPSRLVDRLLSDRVDRGLEHVFTLLALLPNGRSLRLAFAALHGESDSLRGTALEYLETVLPEEVRASVWPLLGVPRPLRTPRSPDEILADLEGARG